MRVMKLLAATLMVAAVLAMSVPSIAQPPGGGGGRGQGGPGGGGRGQGGPGGAQRGPQGGGENARGPGGPGGGGMMGGGGPGRGGMMMMGGGGPGMMMGDVTLSEAQQEKMNAARQEMMGSMQGMRDLSDEERTKKFTEMRTSMEQKVAAILTPEQLKRSKEVRLQMEGTRALGRDEVSEALGLSDGQKKELMNIYRVLPAFDDVEERLTDRYCKWCFARKVAFKVINQTNVSHVSYD